MAGWFKDKVQRYDVGTGDPDASMNQLERIERDMQRMQEKHGGYPVFGALGPDEKNTWAASLAKKNPWITKVEDEEFEEVVIEIDEDDPNWKPLVPKQE